MGREGDEDKGLGKGATKKRGMGKDTGKAQKKGQQGKPKKAS